VPTAALDVANQSVDLDVGDAVAFPGDVPHSYGKPGAVPHSDGKAGAVPARFSLAVFEPGSGVGPGRRLSMSDPIGWSRSSRGAHVHDAVTSLRGGSPELTPLGGRGGPG